MRRRLQRLSLDDRPISLSPGPPAALIGCLALHASPHHTLSRSRLAGTLWPDLPEARARRNLTETLYRLRRALGNNADWLIADDETISLGDVWIAVGNCSASVARRLKSRATTAKPTFVG